MDRVYTKAAVQRITGIPAAKVVKIEVWARICLVVFAKGHGLRPRFISRDAFRADFVKFRMAGSRSCQVIAAIVGDHGGLYTVMGSRPHAVSIHARDGRITCDCEDFYQMVESGIPQPVCKHAYAVLRYHGVGSLAEYVKDRAANLVLF